MISVSILGKYVEEDFVWTLNSITSQNYPELELIISMNELDVPICAVIDTLNANRKPNLKRVLLNTERRVRTLKEHLKYIQEHMQGERLLCLWNGAALWSEDSISKILEGCDNNDFIIGLNVLYEDVKGYVGEKEGGILFPKAFVKTHYFKDLNLSRNLKKQIVAYGKAQHLQIVWRSCAVPIIKSYVNPRQMDHEEYIKAFLNENLAKWTKAVDDGSLQMSSSAYATLCKCADAYSNDGDRGCIDELIGYIIAKQRGGKWDIIKSDKALVVHLTRIKLLRRRYFIKKHSVEEYIKATSYEKKRRAVFVVNEYHLWRSCFQSVYEILLQQGYLVDIVYTPFVHNRIAVDLDKEVKEWENSGLSFFSGEQYDLPAESPDVIFLCKPYDVPDERWCVKELEKVHRRLIYIPYSMATMRGGNEIKRLMFQLPLHFIAWKWVVYSQIYSDLVDLHSYNSQNKLSIGHPKYDIQQRYLSLEEHALYDKIKVLAAGRKIILWNSHFAIDREDPDGAGTFFCIGLDFLEKNISAGDYFVVWRPHPMFWGSIEEQGYAEKVNQLVKKVQDKQVLYVDKGNSQWPGIFVADILVSDASSLIESWIIYNKPVILTSRTMTETLMDDVVYKATTLEELEMAIGDILNYGDKLRNIRADWIEKNYYLPSSGESVAGGLLNVLEKGLFLE